MTQAQLPLTLADDVVVLRQWSAEDFEFYASYLGNERTARHIGGAVDATQAWRHLASMVGHWALRGFGVYAVEDAARGELLGCAGLWQPHGWPCREFVYWFVADAYRDGRALRAAQLARRHIDTAFPAEAITSFIHPQSAAALKLASALGGIEEGEVPLLEFGVHTRVTYQTANAPRSSDADRS